jgi:cyclic pyranopterin monophosphate synthase
MKKILTHIDEKGNAKIVNVATKEVTKRKAIAFGMIKVSSDVISIIKSDDNKKGDVLNVSKIAGIMAAKNTSNLIPLCHPIVLENIDLNFKIDTTKNQIEVTATVECSGKTGVEMESLTAVSISLLTIYDMCKAVDKKMEIKEISLLSKSGGKEDFTKS